MEGEAFTVTDACTGMDAGYKIDVKRLSELGKQLVPNATKISLLSKLIPIFNVMQVF